MKIIDGKPEYSGAAEVLSKIIKTEGYLALWKGFTPYYLRLGPHTVLVFVLLEKFNSMFRKHVLGDTSGKGAGI